MSKNITSASKYLKKEIERLEKEAVTWRLKQSIAEENYQNVQERISKLESQIEELEPKTHEEANV